jgi:rhodanese-related sulfurtransferase
MVKNILPIELKAWIDQQTPLCLLDVRSEAEVEICCIGGSLCIPLNQIANSAHLIPKNQPIVAICHHGMRSQVAAGMLIRLGFHDVYNLTAGIDAWARQVDSSMATY